MMKLGKENDIEDLEFESDSDEAGSDLDMSQIPEDREAEDSDEVLNFFPFVTVKLRGRADCY